MQEIILKIRYFEKASLEIFKKVKFIFFSNPVTFNGQNCQKQKGPGTNDKLLFRLQNKFRKIPLLVMYYFTKFYDVTESGF